MNTTMNPAMNPHPSSGHYGIASSSPHSPTGIDSNFGSFAARRQAAGALPSFSLPPMSSNFQLAATAPLSQSSYAPALSPSHHSPSHTSPFGQHHHSPTHANPYGHQTQTANQHSSPYTPTSHVTGQPTSPYGQHTQAAPGPEQHNYSHQPSAHGQDSPSYSHTSHAHGAHPSSQVQQWPRLGPLPSQPPASNGIGSYRPYPSRQGYSVHGQPGMMDSILSQVPGPDGSMAMIPGMPVSLSSYNTPMMYSQNQPQALQERPFNCDQCPQRFSRNHDLKRHKRIHLAVKPFPCSYCDKSFSRKDALKRHRLVRGCEAMEKNDKDEKGSAEKRGQGSADSMWGNDDSEAGPSTDGSPV